MNAQEAKTIAENVLKTHADKVYKKIEVAANNGQFYVSVDDSTINDQVKKMLEADGYKVQYQSGNSHDRFSTSSYHISWR